MFWQVLAMILFFCVAATIGIAPIAYLVKISEGRKPKVKDWAVIPAAAILLAAATTMAVNFEIFGKNDHSKHCGAGTRFISERHFNAATKTWMEDWQCVAN